MVVDRSHSEPPVAVLILGATRSGWPHCSNLFWPFSSPVNCLFFGSLKAPTADFPSWLPFSTVPSKKSSKNPMVHHSSSGLQPISLAGRPSGRKEKTTPGSAGRVLRLEDSESLVSATFSAKKTKDFSKLGQKKWSPRSIAFSW